MTWALGLSQSRQEHAVAARLEAGGLETYVPATDKYRALFPGYFFVRVTQRNAMRIVLTTRGVKGIVRFGLEPAVVPPSVIRELKARENERGVIVIARKELVGGDVVRITSPTSPFYNMLATFDRMSGKRRAEVFLLWLGNQVRASVDADSIIAA